jgi:hypothetical protein
MQRQEETIAINVLSPQYKVTNAKIPIKIICYKTTYILTLFYLIKHELELEISAVWSNTKQYTNTRANLSRRFLQHIVRNYEHTKTMNRAKRFRKLTMMMNDNVDDDERKRWWWRTIMLMMMTNDNVDDDELTKFYFKWNPNLSFLLPFFYIFPPFLFISDFFF